MKHAALQHMGWTTAVFSSPNRASHGCLQLSAALVAVATLVQVPSVARACTCSSGPDGALLWPLDGSTDVAVDTPIVVARYNHTTSKPDVEVSLITEGGTNVALNEVRTVPPSWNGCGSSELLYLRPADRLEAGGHYKVAFHAPEGEELRSATFDVGERAFVPDAAIEPDITYLAVYSEPGCIAASCPRLAEVRVDIRARLARPAWLFVQSGAAKSGRNHWPFRPEGYPGASVEPEDSHVAQRSVMLGPDACVDIQILGVDGQPLYEDRRCNPDRCAVFERSGPSTCGAPPVSGLDAQRIPTQSCSDPPVVLFDGHGVVYPQPEVITADGGAPEDAAAHGARQRETTDAMPDDESNVRPRTKQGAGASSGGCAVPRSQSSSNSSSGIMLFAVWWSFERLRRSQRRPERSHHTAKDSR